MKLGYGGRLGRNQEIGVVCMGFTCTIATACLFTEVCTFQEWASFMNVQVPLLLGMVLGLSAAVKMKNGNGKAKTEQPSNPQPPPTASTSLPI